MKVITRIEENDQEGFMALIGQRITVFCAVYIYTGDLVGVNETCIKLKDVAIVYETGAFNTKEWKDAQKLPGEFFYVQTAMVESFGVVK
jgi:hypothetical protein